MTDPIKFIFPIQTTTEIYEVVGFLPFEGAEFCAHRHLQESKLWNVAHARTGLKLPLDSHDSLEIAIDFAARLSRECPSASAITWDGANDGHHGKASGPIKELAAEVKAVLAAA